HRRAARHHPGVRSAAHGIRGQAPRPQLMVVGIVGLGQMGMPMLTRLCSAGYDVHFFARRPAVIDEASALGATPASSLRERAETVAAAIVGVYTDDQVRGVALAPDGLVAHLRPGSVLCNHTTGRPATGHAILATASPRGVDVLDCALSGGPADILAGTLTLLIGGDVSVLERVSPVLGAYSSPIVHVGAVGDGQKVKLLNNALFGAQVALAVRI